MTTNTTALVKQLREALIDARDDVQTELQRCHELAGRPQTDRRLAAQVALALDVDIAIADADKWLAAPQAVAQPLTTPAVLDLIPTTIPASMDGDLLWFARAIERAHGIGQPASDTKPCRCGPDGCADSACPGRAA